RTNESPRNPIKGSGQRGCKVGEDQPLGDTPDDIPPIGSRSTERMDKLCFLDTQERSFGCSKPRIGASFRANLADRADLSVDGSISYVGSSQLGIGAPLD